MIKISEQIRNVAEKNCITIQVVDKNQTKEILENIQQKYMQANSNCFLWEELKDFSVINDEQGWSYIKDFVKDAQCLMFFNFCDDKTILKIENGTDLYEILCETYGFEFYITDMKTQYLICFNHHNCLYGCGKAKEWIDKMSHFSKKERC